MINDDRMDQRIENQTDRNDWIELYRKYRSRSYNRNDLSHASLGVERDWASGTFDIDLWSHNWDKAVQGVYYVEPDHRNASVKANEPDLSMLTTNLVYSEYTYIFGFLHILIQTTTTIHTRTMVHLYTHTHMNTLSNRYLS